jgi:hypothetical protein|tara:strand:+ start:190 stop:405 length:216 start_codon:yes stop_codon:yes gene_type:complete
LVPTLDEVMELQCFPLPVEVFSVHVAPEFVEVQIFPFPVPDVPSEATAASLVPSLDDVMEVHTPIKPVEVC